MKHRYTPLALALAVVLGILIGTFCANRFGSGRLSVVGGGGGKLANLLHIIDDQYVDTVNINDLVDQAIPQILAGLDPHSTYVSAHDAALVADDLKGSFFGIGIEFAINSDTIQVQNVLPDGPADHAGLLPGDKIIAVDGKPFVGDTITNEKAVRRLKGPDKSKVAITIKRYGQPQPSTVVITRGEVKTASVAAAYNVDDTTGYIKVKNFGENTYAEMLVALTTLAQGGADHIIIDLRDNTGGYLEAAVQMANEFLPKKRLIVYTQGRRSPRHDYRSDGRGSYTTIPLCVLINEASASASEIFAGAMQDNDRATIIGRRSFGKGLVQQQIDFPDGSLMRLTIARYYTPSGRCIQKPYTKGDDNDYASDLAKRYQHGEFFSRDSIQQHGPKYRTLAGRTVYGGGGIMPDIFVAEDTANVTSYYREALMRGLVPQFSFVYTDRNRERLRTFADMLELDRELDRDNVVEQFADYADRNGLQRRNLMIRRSHSLLQQAVNARIIYNFLGEQAYIQRLNADDPAIAAALRVFYNKK